MSDPRAEVLRWARSQIGTTDPAAYFADAAPAFTSMRGISWCQIGALWCLRQAGLTDWTHAIGGGWLSRLPVTRTPLPGDIEYLANSKAGHPVQHGCVFAGVTADGALVSIDFNVAGGTVAEKVRRAEWYSPRPVFYSIQRLVDAKLAADAEVKALEKHDTDPCLPPFPVEP